VPVRRLTWILAPLALSACDRVSARPVGAPARLVAGRADTVIVNSRHATQLPVRVLDSAGHELPAGSVRYAWVGGDRIAVSDSGHVTCDRRLDAVLRATLGALSTRFVLRCRPIAAIAFAYDADAPLVVGGPPRELDVPAIGVDGKPVQEIAATVTIGDTNVATLHGLTIHPRGAGSTHVKLDIGDCWWATFVEVAERVASPDALRRREQLFMASPLRLVGGERRGWRLPRGEYRVALAPLPDAPSGLALSTTAMNCVPWLGSTQDVHCIALPGASADVRNPRPAGSGELAGTFFVERWDLPSIAAGTSSPAPTRHRPGEKPLCPTEMPGHSDDAQYAAP
jgi:hypothetical protein